MVRIQYTPLKDVHLRTVRWKKPREPALLDHVERIWTEESKKRPLHNGLIFCITGHQEAVLHGAFVPYKYILAQMKMRQLARQLMLRPLGVSGIVLCGSQVLIGKRSALVSQHKHYLECVPSGSLEKNMRPEEQIVKELEEETGILRTDISSLKLLGLYYDRRCMSYDLGYVIRIKRAREIDCCPEYSKIYWMGRDKCRHLIAINRRVVLLSRLLCAQSGICKV